MDELDRDTDQPHHRSLWRMILAPTIWAVHFVACYGFAAVWCAKIGGDTTVLRLGVGAITLVALVIIAIFAWLSWVQWDFFDDRDFIHAGATDEDRREFLGQAGFLLACLSFVAVLYVALPALLIERSCQ